MGYETKMFVGRVCKYPEKDDFSFFWVFANIDLCKIMSNELCELRTEHLKMSSLKCFLSLKDEREYEDMYGDQLVAIPAKEVLDALEKYQKVENYRRARWAIALLTEMVKETENLHVILYGH